MHRLVSNRDLPLATSRRRILGLLSAGVLLLPTAVKAQEVDETAPIKFGTDLSADEETAPTESPGKGRADFVLDRDTLKFSWVISYAATTSPVTAVHIHGPQQVGTNAGVLIDVGAKGLASPLKGSATLDDGMLQFLLSGRMYVNVVTTKYKAGELRGQIKRLRSAPSQ